jgi:hypothetical protein
MSNALANSAPANSASVKSFTDKLKNLLQIINSTLDEYTTKTFYGKPIVNSNGKPLFESDGKTPLKPWLTSSTFGFFTGVPDKITTILQDKDITSVRYKATNGPDYNPLYNTLSLLVFGIAYKRNINLVTAQLDFIVKSVITQCIFGKNNTKYARANIFLGDPPLNVDINHTLKELTDNDLLFYLMNKIDVSMWRGQHVWYEPTKQWGVVGSNLYKSSPLPDFNVDPIAYVIMIHGFILNRWLNESDIAIAKELIIHAIQNPNISNNNFYKYVQQNMDNRFFRKGKYTPPSSPPSPVPSNNAKGGSRKTYSKKY